MPLIDLIPKASRGAWNLLQAGVEAGQSANQIIQSAMDLGLSFRRSTMLEVIRGLKDEVSARSYILSVRNNFLPNPQKFGVALTNLIREYSYRVRVEGIDPFTGEKLKIFSTVSTNQVLTKNQVIAVAEADVLSGVGRYPVGGVENPAYTVEQALRRA